MLEPQIPDSPGGVKYCHGCGLHCPAKDDVCLRCGYPLTRLAERQLLLSLIAELRQCADDGGAQVHIGSLAQFSSETIRSLRRVATYGGATRTVAWLIEHYRARLDQLSKPQEQAAKRVESVQQEEGRQNAKDHVMISRLLWSLPDSQPAAAEPEVLANRAAILPPSSPISRPESKPGLAGSSPVPLPTPRPAAASGPKRAVSPGMKSQPPMPLPRPHLRYPNLMKTVRPLIEAPDKSMMMLGTFMLLLAILALPFLRQFSLLAVIITIVAQLLFGSLAVITRRSQRFHNFSRLYAIFFTFTTPILVIDIISLHRSINIPAVIAVAALYAAVTYGAFALHQRFSPFGYLASISLIASVVAFTLTLQRGYQWATCGVLLLALLGLASLPTIDIPLLRPLKHLLETSWAVMRMPIRITTLVVVTLSAILYVPPAMFIVLLDILWPANENVLLSGLSVLPVFTTLLVLFIWLCLSVQGTHHSWKHYLIPLLFLLWVQLGLHEMHLPPIYSGVAHALALVAVAAFYDTIGRARLHPLHRYLQPGLFLDSLTLMLVVVTPLLAAPLIPVQIFSTGLTVPTKLTGVASFLSFEMSAVNALAVFTLLLSSLLSIGVIIRRARVSPALPRGRGVTSVGAVPVLNYWPWGLILSGMLVIWTYVAAVVWIGVNPFWSLFALTIAIVMLAVFIRQRAGKDWSYPLEVVALGSTAITLLVALQWGHLELALYTLALLFYLVLLLQKRSVWLFIPFLLACLALPFLLDANANMVFLASLGLPLVAMLVYLMLREPSRAFFPSKIEKERFNTTWEWEWPLVMYASLCGVITVYNVANLFVLSLSPWMSLRLLPSVALSLIAVVWYGCATVARVKAWLWLAGGFAIGALCFIGLHIGVLLVVTVVLALFGLAVSWIGRERTWALPFYVTGLLAGVWLGVSGMVRNNPTQTYVLLFGVAALVYVVARLERFDSGTWLSTIFAWWASYIAAISLQEWLLFWGMLGCVVIAMLIDLPGRGKRDSTYVRTNAFITRSLPLYTVAGIAALLTGLDGLRQPALWGILLLEAVLMYLVAWWEKVVWWQGLAAMVGGWAIYLALVARVDGSILLGLAGGALLLSVLADRLIPVPVVALPTGARALGGSPQVGGGPHGRGHRGLAVRASWGWAWFLLALVAFWASGGEPSGMFLRFISTSTVSWLALYMKEYGMAVLVIAVYGVGVLEEQALIAWVAPLLAVWPLVIAAERQDVPLLLGMTVLSFLLALITRRRSGPSWTGASPTYGLACYMLAGVAIGLIGLDGLRQPVLWGILLLEAGLVYVVIWWERAYWWQGLTTMVGGWAIYLAARAQVDGSILLGLAGGALLLSVLADRLIPVPVMALPTVVGALGGSSQVGGGPHGRGYQGLAVRASWGWAWFLLALVAFWVLGGEPPEMFLRFVSAGTVSWLTPYMKEYAMAMLVIAVYGAGMLEEQALIAWAAPLLALWPLVIAAERRDVAMLLGMTVLSFLLALIARRQHSSPISRASLLSIPTFPAYGIACTAILITGMQGMIARGLTVGGWSVSDILLVDAALALLTVYSEKWPHMVVVPALIAAWAIVQSSWPMWLIIIAYSLLCAGIFIMQYIWNMLAKIQRRQQLILPHVSFSIPTMCGQVLVVLFSINESVGMDRTIIAQSGIVASFVLAIMVVAFSYTQQKARVRFWCNYSAGLLCVFTVTWEMEILANNSLPMDLLTIIPSSYLLVTTPFFLRERQRPHMQQAGYMIATVGALALLLPSFLQSFSDQGAIVGVPSNLAAAFLLLAETLALLLLGIVIKERFFVLGGCALVVVAALRVFFYAITQESPLAVLAMVIAGLSIVGVAIFLVVRQRKGAGHAARHTP